jgi:hypothetical protein
LKSYFIHTGAFQDVKIGLVCCAVAIISFERQRQALARRISAETDDQAVFENQIIQCHGIIPMVQESVDQYPLLNGHENHADQTFAGPDHNTQARLWQD